METRKRVRVIGRVQGVYYRASTCDEARRLGLGGWVRNCADGSVELEAQGDEATVAALLAWVRVGPPMARVDEVVVESIPIVAGNSTFSVRR